jgi:ornithine decarboxylase
MNDGFDVSLLLQENNVKIYKAQEHITDIINDKLCVSTGERAFFIVDLGAIITQYNTWMRIMPNIRPYYAVKCNSDKLIVRLLAQLGCYFDCASSNEIALVLSVIQDPTRIIYANPCKQIEQIKYARGNDVDFMTFDSRQELLKIAIYHPKAKLVLRLQVDDSKSMCKFNCKFGCNIGEVEQLLTIAQVLDLNIAGVSFHVGSGCQDATVYDSAIKDCRAVFDIAETKGFHMDTVDIGGGFPGCDSENISFEAAAAVINSAIEKYFSDVQCQFIAEPGRFMVASSHTLVINITNKKEAYGPNKEKQIIYYMNDGVYGSFNCIYFDHSKPLIQPFNERNEEKTYSSVIFGPTCDSVDKIAEGVMLPDLAVGEWCYVSNFGAYTTAAASTFNGFSKPDIVYVLRQEVA